MSSTPVARCGTPSGYGKHQRANEKPCDACAKAKAEYDERWRRASGQIQKRRLAARAQQKAYGELARRHKAEYARLYAEFKTKIAKENA